MLKRFFLGLTIAAGLFTQALGAGSISLSLSQQFDSLGRPLNAGKIYFIQAGTTSTPQNAYQDSALTIPWPNPITLDSAGRVPQLYFADGSIKVRITNAAGVTQLTADNILVVGASSGGGGGGSVDATTVLATGDLKHRYGTGVLDGFVRANGRTIGSATSGATERANADCQALFEYLWGADSNLSVSTGRGATANADWVANKTIALPDWRGRVIAGLDDMGSSAAGRLSSAYFGTGTVLGTAGGFDNHTLLRSQVPTGITVSGSNLITVTNSGTITSTGNNSISASGTNSISASGTNDITVSSAGQGAGSFVVTDSAGLTSSNATGGSLKQLTANGATGSLTSVGSNNISVSNASQNISVANASQNISVSTSAGSVTSTGTNTITGTSNNTDGNPFSNMQPTMVATIYIKL